MSERLPLKPAVRQPEYPRTCLHPNSVMRVPEDVPPRLRLCFHSRLLSVAEFEALLRPAIGLEAVAGAPMWRGDLWNVDHHLGVPRWFYDSIAKQVLVAIDQRVWRYLVSSAADSVVNVHIVRVDEDVAFAFALLEDPSLATNSRVRRLVQLEDALDRSGGVSCPHASVEDLGTLAWVLEPQHLARAEGRRTDAEGGAEILRAVSERVHLLVNGDAHSLGVVGRFDVLDRNGPVALIAEHGPYARLGLGENGIEAFVAERTEGGRHIVTVGLTGAFVPLDLMAVYEKLNAMEPALDEDRWGGSTHIGGSPFGGTHIDASEVLAVMAQQIGSADR